MIFCSQRTLGEQVINDNKKINAGGYTSSSSANSDETVRLLDHSNLNESSNSDFCLIEDDKNKENDSDKGYKTRRYKKLNNKATEDSKDILKKKIPFNYQMRKKFKEDSIQPPNLRGDIEHKNTIERANKIDKIWYKFDLQDKLVRNRIDNLDTNGSVF